MPALLLLTKDQPTSDALSRSLAGEGYQLTVVSDAEGAVRAALTLRLAAVIVDTLSAGDLRALRQQLQSAAGPLPCIFLAFADARWAPGSLPVGAAAGRVVVKPFTPEEVRQAVELTLAAREPARPEVIRLGDLQIDSAAQVARCREAEAPLTPTEFRLLHYLAERKGVVVPVVELLEKVWEFPAGTGSPDLVRAHVMNVRAKLRRLGPGCQVVQTVSRRGYRAVSLAPASLAVR